MSGYIPNSLERCSSILGYDPQAYVYDKPSNMNFKQGANYGYTPDSFSAQNNPNSYQNIKNEVNPKNNGWSIFGKVVLAGIGITALVFAKKKLVPNFHPIQIVKDFMKNKQPGNGGRLDKIKTGISNGFTSATDGIKNAWGSLTSKFEKKP